MRHVRIIFLVLAVICILMTAITISAATPRKISYQGKATDAGGNPVPNGSYPALFALYDRSTAGTVRWSETATPVVSDGGLFSYLLGSNTPIPDSLFARYDSLFLQVVFNGQTQTPRTPIVSVGYALRVNTVDGAKGGTITLTNITDTGLCIIGTQLDTRVGTLAHFETQSPDPVSSIRAVVLNSGTGTTFAGSFLATSTGEGAVRAVYGEGRSNSPWSSARGVYGFASNTAAGNTYGGVFETDSVGTGDRTAVAGTAFGGSGGTWTEGANFNAQGSLGSTFGLRCSGYSRNGTAYGADVSAYSVSSSQSAYGVRSDVAADVAYTGTSYGGYFENIVPSGSNTYGLYGYAHGLTNVYASFGVYGNSEHAGSGNTYGGYFIADSTGVGTAYGVRPVGLSRGSISAYGINSVAANRGSGTVYGGYFEALNYGTGSKFGVYGKGPTSGYAGYFDGHLRTTGNLTVLGTKSAAVEFQPDDYRLVYSQESPECWFEDFGEGQLVNGRAHIELDPSFLKTVTVNQQHQMKVFIQLNDPNCKGTAVIRGATGFDVVELMNGTGNATFTYRVVAKRRGYEDVRLARMAGPTPAEVAAQLEKDRLEQQEVERTLQQDAIKQREESEKQARQLTQKREQ